MKKSKNPVPSKTAGNLPSGKPVIKFVGNSEYAVFFEIIGNSFSGVYTIDLVKHFEEIKPLLEQEGKRIIMGKPVKTTEIALSDPPLDMIDDSMTDSEIDEILAQKVVRWKGYSAWLCVHDLNLRDKPQEWEIRLKYKDETVKITGGSDSINAINTDKEKSDMFLRLVPCLAYCEYRGSVIQPEEADGCPE